MDNLVSPRCDKADLLGSTSIGSPQDRSLSEGELDPTLGRRMQQVCNSHMCEEEIKLYDECWDRGPFLAMFTCGKERDVRDSCYFRCLGDLFIQSRCTSGI